MTESFLKGPLAGKLFRFALPVAFTIICEQLVNGTDVFVLGKFVGPAAMAAVGNDVPVVSLLISLLVGLSLGTNVTLAQAVGARKEAAARKILHTSLLFSVLIGLVFAGIGEIIVRPLLALLAVPPQVLAEAELYLRIFLYPQTPFSSANFNGPVYLSQIVHSGNAAGTPAWTYVVFPQGTYNRWHSHKTGQILIATDGIGYTQTLGGAVQVMHSGDVVYCPPGVIHWHGAASGSHFAHIAISPEDNHDVTWYFFPKLEYEKLGF